MSLELCLFAAVEGQSIQLGKYGLGRVMEASGHQFEKGGSDRFCVNLAGEFGGTAEVADNVRDELMESLTKQSTIKLGCRSEATAKERRSVLSSSVICLNQIMPTW